MKKLVYILSLAIGLLMTGCAQWDPMESLPRDTWGAEPEITIEVSPLDSITGALISDKMDVVFYLKNATNFSFVYDEGEAQSIDFTALLKGQYGGWSAEPAVEGDTLGIQLTGFEPGKTYTIYAVVANAAGVQTTAVKTVGAVDVTAPAIVANSELSATNNGKQVTVAFDEAIVRTDAMPAVTYEVLNENLESYATGDATAMASGRNLVVSLPSTFEFDGFSIVLLSFAEGSVEDAYGNKMAALVNVLDEEGVPNGPWWSYDPNEVIETDSFFRDGHGYAFVGKIDLGNGYSDFGGPIMPLTYVESNVAIGEVSATAWTMPSILNMFSEEAISSGAVTPNEEVPAYTYASTVNGQETEIISFYDITNGFPVLGTMILGQNNQTYTVYAADYDEEAGQVYPGWDFAVFEFQGGGQTFDGCAFIGKSPVIIVIDGNQAGMVAEIDPEAFQFHDGDVLMGSSMVDVLDAPVVLKNVNVNREKVFRIAE